MHKLIFFVIAAISAGHSRADPKCYTGPNNNAINSPALITCVDIENIYLQWREFERTDRHFQYWSNHRWKSAADCLGGCTPCLLGAGMIYAEWVKCDQEVRSAHRAVGWSPPGKGFGGNKEPCNA
ncbi:hypothetical protein GGS26DRAFT_589097 [Hypomontagnella submonticulosa]|nr:hypothetical protein GGS26DRAFT_589097 [Hypomontagnella submonticulosa]